MKSRVAALVLAIFAMALAVTRAGAEPAAADRQILVMLRPAPPHFRPDAAYAAVYDSRVRQGAQRRIAEQLARQHALKVIEGWPMPALGVDCFVLEGATPLGVEAAVEAIGRDARVESVQAMNVFRVLGHNDPLYPLQPSAQLWQLADVHRFATGRNVRIAEIDTGVDVDQPDLRGRVAVNRNFAAPAAAAPETHGTAIAGIMAARADDGIGIAGIAPAATLIALRACAQEPGGNGATCTSFALARALQSALDENAQVMNLSLGGPRDRLLERLLDAALARRIVVVAAVDPRVAGGGFPAAHPGVLAVMSEQGATPPPGALFAPGRDIPATLPGEHWGFVSGSSYAAAHVASVAALLLEAVPDMGPRDVQRAFASTTTATASGEPAMIDVCAAIARAANACVCGCMLARGAH
jgi:subtilisin family serine protease